MQDDPASAFAQRGATLVRGALSPALIAAVRAEAERALAERTVACADGALASDAREKFERGFVPMRDLVLPCEPDALIPAAATEIARAYLGSQPRIAAARGLRFADPGTDATHLAFHRDEDILGRRAVNVWIALTPCGVDAPGLEVALDSARIALAPAGDPAASRGLDRVRLDADAVVAAAGADALFAPAFEPGDVLIFSGATMHRTFVRPEMTRRRLSLELRLVAAE